MTPWPGATVTVAPSLLEETYLRLRSCGQWRRECQVFWIAALDEPSQIVRVVHPAHAATAVSVEVDIAWLTRFFFKLADRQECIRVQVHSHPGAAFHSDTDDRWPIVHQDGLLSLVIPDFAAGEPDLVGSFLAEQGAHGRWYAVDPFGRVMVGTEVSR